MVWDAASVGMALVLLIWVSHFLRLRRASLDTRYQLGAGRYEGPDPSHSSVTILVPARNEERNIAACLDALQAVEHEDLQVLVLDDRSEDGTGALLAEYAARWPALRVLEGEGPPPGWMGKVAALWRAQAEATGDYLLFVDADVRLAPESVRQCLHYIHEEEVDGVTLIGRLDNESFWERVVQPVVGSLILAGNRAEWVNDPERRDAMANGQFIFVSREAYDAVGGHEALSGEVLDDVGFARLMKSQGRSLHMLHGRELFRCRMYQGLSEIWEGWSKNLFPGLHHSLALTGLIWTLVFATALWPFLVLAWQLGHGRLEDPFTWLCGATVAGIYATYAYGLGRMGQRATDAWTYPVGVVVLLGILLNSALRIRLGLGVSWKGRRYTDTGTGGPSVKASVSDD